MSKRKHAIEAHFQQGLRLHGAGRLDDAAQIYQQILSGAPNHAGSLHMLGVAALQSGQPQAALDLIAQAIALKPSEADFHVNRASALLALGQPDAAIATCRDALRFRRNSAPANLVLGHALSDAGRPEDAIGAYQEALRLDPRLDDIRNSLGLALRLAGRLEEAAEIFRQASGEEAQNNLAGVLKERGQYDEAEQLYRDALRRHSNDARQHYNLSLLLLLMGRFTEGWREYEWRFRAGAAQVADCVQPRWRGEPLAGRTLLVRAEQGFGDMIQFCRFAPLVAGGRVIVEVHRPLCRLLSTLRGVDDVVALGDPLPHFDLHIPTMSLPSLFDAPSAEAPYIAAEPELVAAWRARLGPRGFKIGVAWQGNPASLAELGRTYPVSGLHRLSQLPDVRLISLQKHHGLDQLAQLPDGLQIEVPEIDVGSDAFVDTAAVMQSLDLVITSDSAVAHLAGAMGRRAWVALQHVPDWRWLLEREDSPWYPSLRLYRQAKHGDWDSVFARMTESVAVLVRHD